MLIGAALLCAACDHGHHGRDFRHQARLHEAQALIATHCAACHRVPGIAGANGRVGPSLDGISRQQVIAGHFANTPFNLTEWIEHPQEMLTGDAMPEMGLTHEQVRKIVDYLYTME